MITTNQYRRLVIVTPMMRMVNRKNEDGDGDENISKVLRIKKLR